MIVKVLFFGLNVATVFAYFIDKGRAIRDEYRIPEMALHAMCLLGGAPGAEIGRRFANHKTRKLSFRLVIVLGMLEIMTVGAFSAGTHPSPNTATTPTNRYGQHQNSMHADAHR